MSNRTARPPRTAPAAASAPEVVIPEDGHVSLGDGDYVEIGLRLNHGQVIDLLELFDAHTLAIRGRTPIGERAEEAKLMVRLIALLARAASVRPAPGELAITDTTEASIRLWPPDKVATAADVCLAIKERLPNAGR